MELEVTWKRAIKVWWAYFWRSVVVVFLAMLFVFMISIVLSVILVAVGVDPSTVEMLIGVSSFIIGIGVSVLAMKMIIGKNLGEFRLVLVKSP